MISIFTWFGYEIEKKACFDGIKQAGFDGVILWWKDDFGDTDFRENPEMARRTGLYVENIHASVAGINSLWLDGCDGSDLETYFLRVVEECGDYEIPTMVFHLSSGENPPPWNEIGLKRVQRIVERGEKRGVNIAFENLRRLGYLDYVLGRVDSPRAGFCFDSGHWHCWSPEVDLLEQYGPRLMALHLHDNDGTADQHRLPFDGAVDWENTMKRLGKTGYSGPLALEAENIGYENLPPKEFLSIAFRRAKRLEGQRGQMEE